MLGKLADCTSECLLLRVIVLVGLIEEWAHFRVVLEHALIKVLCEQRAIFCKKRDRGLYCFDRLCGQGHGIPWAIVDRVSLRCCFRFHSVSF